MCKDKPDKNQSTFQKIDDILKRIFRYVSYVSAVIIFVMVLAVTANVIYSKLTHDSIPSVNDWVTYLLVPVVFLGAGYMMLDRGLIEVDFLSKHFPKVIRKGLALVSNVLGILVSALIIHYQWSLMLNYISLNKMSSISKLHFHLWYFPLIIMIGMAMMVIAFLWQIVRMFAKREDVEKEKGGDIQ